MSVGALRFLYRCAGVDSATFQSLNRPTVIIPPPRPRWFRTKLSCYLGLTVLESYMIYFSVNYYAHALTGKQSKWIDKHVKDSRRSQKEMEQLHRLQLIVLMFKESLHYNMEVNERWRKLLNEKNCS